MFLPIGKSDAETLLFSFQVSLVLILSIPIDEKFNKSFTNTKANLRPGERQRNVPIIKMPGVRWFNSFIYIKNMSITNCQGITDNEKLILLKKAVFSCSYKL